MSIELRWYVEIEHKKIDIKGLLAVVLDKRWEGNIGDVRKGYSQISESDKIKMENDYKQYYKQFK